MSIVLATSSSQEWLRDNMAFQIPQVTLLKSVDKDYLHSIFTNLQAEIERLNKRISELEKTKK